LKITIFISISLLATFLSVSTVSHIKFPDHFPDPNYDFSQNLISFNGIELGRALFYDPLLSSDGKISCASCHSPYNSFAHTDHALSHGINDSIGNRNAPALINLAWHSTFNWDGAINHLDMQALAPIQDSREMNTPFKELIIKLQNSTIYPDLFYQAYGDSTITGELVLKALAQFQLTLVSANAKYDQKIKGLTVFNEQETKGEVLFNKHCNACHTAPLFTNNRFISNGLSENALLMDQGRFNISKDSADLYKFKIPTLRNLSYTFPYMHDGRFKSIRAVLNHYSENAEKSEYSDPRLKKGIKLSDDEKTDLTSFLLTLNDKDFIFNPNNKFPKELLLNK